MEIATSPTLLATPASSNGTAGDSKDRLPAGAKAGEYVIDRLIGAGAMGEVYLGRHPVIGKRVAIKVLRRAIAETTEGQDRFAREARAAGQIDHPNVVDVFAFGRLDDGRFYLVMDFVDGEPLRARLAAGPLPQAEALDILAAIADALDAAHARGVVHRDLKPDNIVMAGKVPKVLDFGLAKLVSTTAGELSPATLTAQGSWMGTPGYMAPEQWSADGARAASDRYALGVIAFELLSGRLPFDAGNVPQMMEQHFRAAVPSVTARGGKTTAFDAVLRRALAKDPDQRFPSSVALVEALRDAAGGRAGGHARAGSNKPLVAALAAVGLLGAGVAVVMTTHDSGGTPDAVSATIPPPPPRIEPVAVHRAHVTSEPTGAHIRRADGSRDFGPTPVDVDLGDAATTLDVIAHRPGYTDARATLHDATPAALRLTAAGGFEGVWKMPKGELRVLERKQMADGDDVVVVSKTDAVRGPRQFFRRYAFGDSTDTPPGVVEFFVNEEAVGGLPAEPSCHVPERVMYRYDPARDRLELIAQHVKLVVVGTGCVVSEDAVGEPVVAERVDKLAHTEISAWIEPPSGSRLAPSSLPTTRGKTASAKSRPAPNPAPSQKASDPNFYLDNTDVSKSNGNAPNSPPPQPAQGVFEPQAPVSQQALPPPQTKGSPKPTQKK